MLTLFRVIKFEIYHGMDARIIYIYKVSNKIFSENITCLEGYPVTSNKKLTLVSSSESIYSKKQNNSLW